MRIWNALVSSCAGVQGAVGVAAGGSVGVSLFGAIFAAGLATGLADHFPPGATLPAVADPSAIQALP